MDILLEKQINHLVAQEFRQLMIEQQRKLIAQHIIVEEAGKILVKHGLITEQALTNFVNDSREKAELFAVSSEIVINSK